MRLPDAASAAREIASALLPENQPLSAGFLDRVQRLGCTASSYPLRDLRLDRLARWGLWRDGVA